MRTNPIFSFLTAFQNPYRNGNFTTRTFINSEILFIEKTNYFDVDLSSHPHGVIGSSPESIHLAPVKVNLNQTESKISKLPLAAEDPISVEQFGFTSINGRSSLNVATINSLGNSEELDGAAAAINGRPNGGRTMTALALKRSVANDRSLSSSASTSSSFRNSMMDSDPTDYSGENSNYKPKFVNLLQQSNKVKAGA